MDHKIISSPKIPKELGFALVFACLIFGLAIFAISYLGMRYGMTVGKFNQPILSWTVDHRIQSITILMKGVTTLSAPLILTPIAAVAAIIWAYFKKDTWRPIILISSLVLASITSMGLKLLFMDSRPPQINMIPTFETDFSFPSGHTISMAVLLLVFGYLVYSRNFSTNNFVIWVMVAIVGTTIIATSRLYLGYHWLTDILASLGLALIILAIAISVDLIASRKYSNTNL